MEILQKGSVGKRKFEGKSGWSKGAAERASIKPEGCRSAGYCRRRDPDTPLQHPRELRRIRHKTGFMANPP
jgi:hypothetical protein